jgi:hypothetical protein
MHSQELGMRPTPESRTGNAPNTGPSGQRLDEALVGNITFDEITVGIESEANAFIKDCIDRIMG